MLLATVSLFLSSANAATPADLTFRCPDGYDTWSAVNQNQWYFGTDWDEWLANGTSPFDGSTGAVYPAGFRPYVLARYSEPPICMFVPQSRDKKVEILMESPMDNANLCINDAAYSGVGNNNVGSVQNCGTGKIYACFTAATATNENFGFYVDCKEGCEDMDIDVWIRIRVSDRSWDDGKTDTASDLEHWCEAERGTELDYNGEAKLYYTYPSDLLPDQPSKYPFHIQQLFGGNPGSQTKPHVWLISLIALVGLACLFA